MHRRDVLALAAGMALAATGCVTAPSAPPQRTASPASASPTPATASLDRFVALSALLTGFKADRLSPTLAATYLESLQRHHAYQVGIDDMYFECGLADPKATEAQRETRLDGLLKRKPQRVLADKILTCWFSGLYDTPQGTACATYQNALAWQSVKYASAPGQCHGNFGDWAKPPVG